MHSLLLAAWLSLPAYPLNPVAQDTIDLINMHFTVGISGPSNVLSSGPEITSKYELRLVHPVVVRAAVDYRLGKVNSVLFPAGEIHTGTFSADVLYYRGTSKLTGYLGIGAIYSVYRYGLTPSAADSLRKNDQVQEVSIMPTFGMRLTMGLRFNRNISLELGITESRPLLQLVRRLSANSYSVTTRNMRLSDMRLTVGYLWTIRGI